MRMVVAMANATLPKVPLPFPKCPKGCEGSMQGYHAGCGAPLWIEPVSQQVWCEKGHHWYLWESTYRCKHGHEFTPSEVSAELDDLLWYCRVSAEHIQREMGAKAQAKAWGEESFKSFLMSVLGGIGEVLGNKLTLIVDTFVKAFF